jgi:hypothetical protein
MIETLGAAGSRWLVVALLLVGGCSTTMPMDTYVPARCHGSAAAFGSYDVEFVDVPGFIRPVIESALHAALAAQGLSRADADPDVHMVSTFFLIDRSTPPDEGDPFGEPVSSGSLNRFVAHLEVDAVDARSNALLWTGSMYRAHAIRGGETFHDQRAELIIRQAFDELFVGLTTPCE